MFRTIEPNIKVSARLGYVIDFSKGFKRKSKGSLRKESNMGKIVKAKKDNIESNELFYHLPMKDH